MKPGLVAAILPALLLTAACETGVSLTDTGYEGTWTRGNDRVTSTLAIVKRGDGYLVRWGLETSDGRKVVRCDWNGACEERIEGESVATYRFRNWIDPDNGRLQIECTRELADDTQNAIHYIDELVVRKQGKKLVSRTEESGGQSFEGKSRPKRVFAKVSDAVVDPPDAGADRG